ncbi:hypothetical protein RJ639_012734 [Escallonia herrerae]|uniref:Uncharacterized protein n=1 Tax=Escallonia herrerae TaxID=1293975 RepID=A0AA89ARH7_9ASTE|nr:hypothetical protein RJ639_012734 [Escallonia herrerae]
MGEDVVPDVSKSGLVMVESGIQDSIHITVVLCPFLLMFDFKFVSYGLWGKARSKSKLGAGANYREDEDINNKEMDKPAKELNERSNMAANPDQRALLFLLTISFALLITSEARTLLRGVQAMQEITDSQLMLRRLPFDCFTLEYYRRRSLGASSDRVAPGGPDPQHHSQPPAY